MGVAAHASRSAGGTFEVEWIKVGEEACTSDFLPYARTTRFYDMFDAVDISEEGQCPEGYTAINAQPGGAECLSIKPGMELLASRFEYRRCAHRACCACMSPM